MAYKAPDYSLPVQPYHTKGKDDWGTPDPLFDILHKEFGFTLDVCADEENHKCETYLTEAMDALHIDWWGRCFMNPPFSLLDKFLVKMITELKTGRIELGVAVVASRTDTEAMFMASCYAGEVRFLKGRVSYLVYPTPWQRACCNTLSGIDEIDPKAWVELVKNIQLPKMAIKALMADPDLPGGHPKLAQAAPFPSTVLVFDGRKKQSMVFWDWKHGFKASYVYGYETKGPISGGGIHPVFQKGPTGKLEVVKKNPKPCIKTMDLEAVELATLKKFEDLNAVTLKELGKGLGKMPTGGGWVFPDDIADNLTPGVYTVELHQDVDMATGEVDPPKAVFKAKGPSTPYGPGWANDLWQKAVDSVFKPKPVVMSEESSEMPEEKIPGLKTGPAGPAWDSKTADVSSLKKAMAESFPLTDSKAAPLSLKTFGTPEWAKTVAEAHKALGYTHVPHPEPSILGAGWETNLSELEDISEGDDVHMVPIHPATKQALEALTQAIDQGLTTGDYMMVTTIPIEDFLSMTANELESPKETDDDGE